MWLKVMQIKIIAVGKLKEKYWQQAVAEYCKRLSPYAKIQITDVYKRQMLVQGLILSSLIFQ